MKKQIVLAKGVDWNVVLYIEPRDVWVGLFMKTRKHWYVCPLPCVVIEWWHA